MCRLSVTPCQQAVAPPGSLLPCSASVAQRKEGCLLAHLEADPGVQRQRGWVQTSALVCLQPDHRPVSLPGSTFWRGPDHQCLWGQTVLGPGPSLSSSLPPGSGGSEQMALGRRVSHWVPALKEGAPPPPLALPLGCASSVLTSALRSHCVFSDVTESSTEQTFFICFNRL